MGIPEVKITKIRTFHDDFLRAQEVDSLSTVSNPKTNKPAEVEKIDPKELKIPEVEKPAPKVTASVKPLPKEPFEEPTESKPPVKVLTDVPPTPKPVIETHSKSEPKKLGKIEVDTSEIIENGQSSLMSTKEDVFDVVEGNDYLNGGTIITDQKRKRHKMLPALLASVMDWFTRASESIQKFNEGNKPKNKVRSTKSREEVVQKAAIRSALAPKDDFVSISKKISNAPKQASQNATLTIGKPSELPTPTWGSYEKSAPDVEGVKPVVEVTGFQSEDPTKVTSEIASAITEPAPSEPVWPTVSMETVDTAPEIIDEVVTETSAGEAASLTPESIPEETGEIIEAQETVIDEIEIPEIVDDTLVTTEGFPTQSPAPAYQSSGSTAAPEMSFSLWRIGAVSILAILLGITTTFWIFGGKKDTVVIQQDEVSSLVKSEEHIPILLGGDTQDFWETVSKVQPRATTVFANIYPTLNISGEIKPATVEQILNILSLQAPGTFTRAITDMSIGLYQNKEPFIVLKVTSFDAAFSGMLSWEKTMSGDLAPFFGTPVLGTFDSRARTETQISEPFFVDTIISNNDTRILVDEARSERIIYSFLNKNTILITSSREALKAVSAAVK